MITILDDMEKLPEDKMLASHIDPLWWCEFELWLTSLKKMKHSA